jgi:hypothetical protein
VPGVAEPEVASYRVTTAFRGNAKTWANMFEARMLEPGIVSYEDVGFGKSFLTREAIERSMNSFVGRPLILSDDTRRKPHKKITPEQLEKEAKGYISSWFWGPDGWAWARGVVFDDKAKDAIKRIGLCSCHGRRPGRKLSRDPLRRADRLFFGRAPSDSRTPSLRGRDDSPQLESNKHKAHEPVQVV